MLMNESKCISEVVDSQSPPVFLLPGKHLADTSAFHIDPTEKLAVKMGI